MKIQFIKENMISYTEPINDYDTYHLKCTAYTTNVNGVFKIEWYIHRTVIVLNVNIVEEHPYL